MSNQVLFLTLILLEDLLVRGGRGQGPFSSLSSHVSNLHATLVHTVNSRDDNHCTSCCSYRATFAVRLFHSSVSERITPNHVWRPADEAIRSNSNHLTRPLASYWLILTVLANVRIVALNSIVITAHTRSYCLKKQTTLFCLKISTHSKTKQSDCQYII